MRILEILENEGGRQFVHTLCFVGVNGAGKTSFNGTERQLFLLSPGAADSLPDNSSGFVVSAREFSPSGFLSVQECLFRISPSEDHGLALLYPEKGGFVPLSSACSFFHPFTAGIITVSDKGSRGEREDGSGPALAAEVTALGADVLFTSIVPDDHAVLVPLLKEWSDGKGLDLILCTGGTGFSPRDVTPEALDAVCEKHVPGIGEAMRAASLKITRRAVLSRANAVIRGKTLIISLPGSTKAALECLAAVAPALRHGIEILCGRDGECGSNPV